MAGKPQPVTVPVFVHGGVEEGMEEWLFPSPKVSQASNVLSRKPGSLQKIPGWTALGSYGGSASRAFLCSRPGKDLITAGPAGPEVYGPTRGWYSPAGNGAALATRVRLKHAYTPRGLPSDVNICHNGGYTALVVQVTEDETIGNGALSGDMQEAHCLVVDSDQNVVWGPYIVNEIRSVPRVETYTSGGAIFFVFTGLDQAYSTLATTNIALYGFSVNMSAPAAPSVALLATITKPQAVGVSNVVLYDTYSEPSMDRCLMAFYDHTSGDFVFASYRGTTLVSSAAITATDVTTGKNPSVYYDDGTDTVLAYTAETNVVYTTNLTFGASVVTATGPGTAVETPLWYTGASSQVYLKGYPVSLSGGPSPATATVGAIDHAVDDVLLDPQGLSGVPEGVVFFDKDAPNTTSLGYRSHAWFDATFFQGAGTYPVVPLLQTVVPQLTSDGFHGATYSATGSGSIPQTTRDSSGRVLVPVSWDTLGGKRYLKTRAESLGGPHGNIGAGGPFNADRSVGWVEISTLGEDLEHSEVSHNGSLVVAAGNVSVWDGTAFFDAGIAPPEVSNYDDTNSAATTYFRGTTFTDTLSAGGPPGTCAHIGWWGMKAVLVYTDQNGVEWRSEPSPMLTDQSIQGNSDGTTPYPRISLQLDTSHERFIDHGGSFDVEIYVTERDDGAANSGTAVGASAEADIVEEFYLAQRTPLQSDGSGYFVPDWMKVAFGPNTDNPIQLYTDTGELAPVRPPSSHAVAVAGGYAFLVPAEFPDQLWPSKPLEQGRGIEWAPEIALPAPGDSGGIVSLAAQGDRLVLLCRQGVWELFAGSGGPDAFGAGAFPPMRLLHSGDGCVSPNGTVVGPFGVFWCSKSGPKLLRPDGVVDDIGLAVKDSYDPDYILDVAYHDLEDEIWLAIGGAQSNATQLVYNVRTGTWTTGSLNTLSIHYHDGLLYRLDDTSNCLYEAVQSPHWQDNTNVAVVASVTTGWLSFQDILSFKRCQRVGLAIRLDSPSATYGQLKVQVKYDYDDSDDWDEIHTFDFTDGASVTAFQKLRFKPERQKFESIKLHIYDASESNGESQVLDLGWSLVGLEFRMLPKTGITKLPATFSQ